MTIDVKYKPGQSVWINDVPKARQITVHALRIVCIYNGYSADNWGETTVRNGGYPLVIQYSTETYPNDKQWINQELLFESKDELLKSI